MVKTTSIGDRLFYTAGARPISDICKLNVAPNPSMLKLPHIYKFWPGGIYDYKFLALVQGSKFNNIYPQNKEKCWNEDWSKDRKFIKKYMPIITGFNPQAFG